jgi:primosomal protein N' (replication factor Y)
VTTRRKRGGDLTPGLVGDDPPPEVHKPKAATPRKRKPRERVELSGTFADVALNRPMRCEYTYAVPRELLDVTRVGCRVAVPFGRDRTVGVVTGLRNEVDFDVSRVRAVARVLDEAPIVDAQLIELTRWMAAEYACSWGEALAAVLPGSLKHEKGRRMVPMAHAAEGIGPAELAELEEKQPKQHRLLRTLLEVGAPIELHPLLQKLQLSSSPAKTLERRGWIRIERVVATTDLLETSSVVRVRPEHLTADQTLAVETIEERLTAGAGATFLLHGVTGSGKTEVYLRVIEHALSLDKGAIVLVPEIALTPQTVSWFRSRFGEVAVLHSRMTDVQRRDMWLDVQRGRYRVVVGARSAIFAPVRDLGVIVVDEEHEPSFKQAETPRYHARDVAVERARRLGAVGLLGSATPSLEARQRAEAGVFELLRLMTRVHGGDLPKIEIVDMRGERGDGTTRGPVLFSRRLKLALGETLERGEQALIFRNRRGFAPTLWCRACGETAKCQRCDISLTFHRKIGRAVCHTCCEEQSPPKACPSCTAPALHYLGMGSERVADELAMAFPDARIRRMDSDTMLRREDYEDVLDAFGRGEIDMLVGTQMIAKGLDFPRVTLVGIVSADSSLHLPDFRAAERTFQLLVQVAGRAGRGDLPGRILVQTQTPDHPAIVRGSKHDYDGFSAEEDRLRRELSYPPHGRLVRIVFDDEDKERVLKAARACAERLAEPAAEERFQVLGPAECPIAMLRNRHRQHILLKAPGAPGLSSGQATGFGKARELLIAFAEEHARPRITIDVDPVSML